LDWQLSIGHIGRYHVVVFDSYLYARLAAIMWLDWQLSIGHNGRYHVVFDSYL
jgi:hypothetical protein